MYVASEYPCPLALKLVFIARKENEFSSVSVQFCDILYVVEKWGEMHLWYQQKEWMLYQNKCGSVFNVNCFENSFIASLHSKIVPLKKNSIQNLD